MYPEIEFMRVPLEVDETKMTIVQSFGCLTGPIHTKPEPDVEINTQNQEGLGDQPCRKKTFQALSDSLIIHCFLQRWENPLEISPKRAP